MCDLIFSVSRLRLIPPSAGWGHTQRDRRRLHDVSPAWTQRAWISWGAASRQRFHVSWSSRWLFWVWIVSWASESRAAVQLCDDFPRLRSVLDPARHLPEPSSWCGADGSESVKSNRVWWCTCSERVAARGAFQWVWAEFKPEEWRSCVRDNGEIVFSSLDINLRPCCSFMLQVVTCREEEWQIILRNIFYKTCVFRKLPVRRESWSSRR